MHAAIRASPTLGASKNGCSHRPGRQLGRTAGVAHAATPQWPPAGQPRPRSKPTVSWLPRSSTRPRGAGGSRTLRATSGATARSCATWVLRPGAGRSSSDPATARPAAATHGEWHIGPGAGGGRPGRAVADCALVAGTSARTAGLVRRQSVGPGRDYAATRTSHARRSSTALVFGPEHRGLTNRGSDTLSLRRSHSCRPDLSGLEFGAGRRHLLYELRCAWFMMEPGSCRGDSSVRPVAAQELDVHGLAPRRLEGIHFPMAEADSLMHAIRIYWDALSRPRWRWKSCWPGAPDRAGLWSSARRGNHDEWAVEPEGLQTCLGAWCSSGLLPFRLVLRSGAGKDPP